MAVKSFRERNPVLLGIVSLTVVLGVVAFTFFAGTLGLFRGGYEMSGVFAETGGVRVNQDVKVAGVRVGSITDIRPDYENGNVVITWVVDDGIKLGPKTRAEIMMANALGGRYLRLSGPVVAPYMSTLPEERRRIPLDRTRTPFLINEALKRGSSLMERLDTKSVDKLLAQIKTIDSNDRGRLSRMLAGINEVGQIVGDNEPEIKELLANSQKLTTIVNNKDKQLAQLIDNASIVLTQLSKRRNELATTLGSGNELVTSLSGLVSKHQKELITIIDDLNATIGRLEPHRADFNDALAKIGPTFTGLASIGGNGPWLEVILTGLGPLSPELLAGLASGAQKANGGKNTGLAANPQPGKKTKPDKPGFPPLIPDPPGGN